MTADLLRQAAALIRERAEAATDGVCPAWTQAAVRHIARNCDIDCEYLDCDHVEDEAPMWDRYDDATHIASWHPAVALAVADWLDAEAVACTDSFGMSVDEAMQPTALAVARAYLDTPT